MEKQISKNFKLSGEKWISLSNKNGQIQHFLDKKQSEKNKTDERDNTKRNFINFQP